MKKQTGVLILILVFTAAAFAGAQEEGKRPFILVSNDDGFDTPGIQALAAALTTLGDVVIVAPKGNQSGSSQSIIYKVPIFFGRAEPIGDVPVWWVDSTPATTVRFALEELFKERRPDLVVSGINGGVNIGDGVYYSGTIGAAREGAMRGIPAIAVSMERRDADHDGAAAAAVRIARMYLSMDNRPELLNVNIPGGDITEKTPFFVTTIRASEPDSKAIVRDNPREPGQQYFWVMFKGYTGAVPGSDLHALMQGAISVMPLLVDPVAQKHVDNLRSILSRLHQTDCCLNHGCCIIV